jgi:hypothetical protein
MQIPQNEYNEFHIQKKKCLGGGGINKFFLME